jgi:hypothetical protein
VLFKSVSLKCSLASRCHHLLKTFWTGFGGWADQQLPDGTVVWTSPTGKKYVTHPNSRIFFPHWDTTTADLPVQPVSVSAAAGDRGVMMPTRRRTRAAERLHRISTERSLNDAHVAERNMPPPF